jgi:hypothetical protein
MNAQNIHQFLVGLDDPPIHMEIFSGELGTCLLCDALFASGRIEKPSTSRIAWISLK